MSEFYGTAVNQKDQFKRYISKNAERFLKKIDFEYFMIVLHDSGYKEFFYKSKEELDEALKQYIHLENNYGNLPYHYGEISKLEELIQERDMTPEFLDKQRKKTNEFVRKIEEAHKATKNSTLRFG